MNLIIVLLGLSACKSSSEESGTEDSFSAVFLRDMSVSVESASVYGEINQLEEQVASFEQAVLAPWRENWLNRQAGNISIGLDWAAEASLLQTRDGIQELSWTPTSGEDTAEKYLSAFSSVHSFSLRVYDVRKDNNYTTFWVRFDLRGEVQSTQRRHDRGQIKITLDSNRSIVSAEAFDFERLQSTREPSFTDVTSQWGLDELPRNDRKEAIRRGGYALGVADYDGDGNSDIIVGGYDSVKLMRNTGTRFEDVTTAAGLKDEPLVKSAVFADLDNDGDRDLILLRFVIDGQDGLGDFVLYENQGNGQFEQRLDVLPRSRSYDRAMPMTLADFNADGLLDIYIGFPGIRDFTSGILNRERPNWLASQGIWFNEGGLKFAESDAQSAVIIENDVYAHAALASDINGDGQPELIVVDDSGRTNPIYQQTGSGEFENVADALGLASRGMSMGITAADINGDGLNDLITTNVTLLAGERIINESQHVQLPHPAYKSNFDMLDRDYKALQLYINQGDGQFDEVSEAAGLDWAGDAAGAGEWIDFNHDGLLDYYLPNGLWTSGETDIDSLFFRAELVADHDPLQRGVDPQADAAYDSREMDFSDENTMQNDVHGGPIFIAPMAANPMLRFLREATDAKNNLKYSLGGRQHNRLYRNNGDGTFTEVGFLEAADRIEDGYIVSPSDIDNDGHQDLVLRNTDPAPKHDYAPVVILKNERNNDATVKVVVHHPDNQPIEGVQIHAQVGEQHIVREIRSVNGAVQAEPIALIGLGAATQIDRLEVRWPSGDQVELLNVPAGVVTASPSIQPK